MPVLGLGLYDNIQFQSRLSIKWTISHLADTECGFAEGFVTAPLTANVMNRQLQAVRQQACVAQTSLRRLLSEMPGEWIIYCRRGQGVTSSVSLTLSIKWDN